MKNALPNKPLIRSGFLLHASTHDRATITFNDPPGNDGDAWVEFDNGSTDSDGNRNIVTVSVLELEDLMRHINKWGLDD